MITSTAADKGSDLIVHNGPHRILVSGDITPKKFIYRSETVGSASQFPGVNEEEDARPKEGMPDTPHSDL